MLKWKVYISSTYVDLKDLRSNITHLFKQDLEEQFELGRIMEWMYDTGEQKPFVEDCKKEVRACDIYIIILGNRIGSYPPGESRSYTEVELDTALEESKHVFCFRLKEFDDNQIDNKAKHDEILNKFQGKPIHKFETWEDLKNGLKDCLFQFTSKYPVNPNNPYKGLLAFAVNDGDRFFGRGEEIEKILRKLIVPARPILLSIIGGSGIGKTSFMQAGVLYQLKTRDDLGFKDWTQVIITPGQEPYTNLLYQLKITNCLVETGTTISIKEKVIIFFNQFEEIISQCNTENAKKERENLFKFLDECFPKGKASQHIVLTTFRSDFVSQLTNFDFVRRNTLVGLKTLDFTIQEKDWDDAIKEIIRGPAALHGVTFTNPLVDQVVEDIKEIEGSLPILQFTLQRLWNLLDKARTITSDDYNKLSQGKGLSGIIEAHADETVNRILGQDDQRLTIVKTIFFNLVEVRENFSDVRKTLPKDQLMKNMEKIPGPVTEIFEELVAGQSRLLVVSESRENLNNVEIIHEVLIRKWHRLQGWLQERRSALIFKEDLSRQLTTWERDNDIHSLLSPTRLSEALKWQAGNTDLTNSRIDDFIDKSKRKEAFIYKQNLLGDISRAKENSSLFYRYKDLKELSNWARANQDLLDEDVRAFMDSSRKRIRNRKLTLVSSIALFFTLAAGAYFYNARLQLQKLCSGPLAIDWKRDNVRENRDQSLRVEIGNDLELQYLSCLNNVSFLNARVTFADNAVPKIAERVELKTLMLSGDTITNLRPLGAIKGLRELVLTARGIHLSGITSLAALESLSIYSADTLSALDGLRSLTKLNELNLVSINWQGNLFGTIGHAPITKLEVESFEKLDIAGIEELQQLKFLSFSSVVSIDNVESLRKVSDLNSLRITSSPALNSMEFLSAQPNLKFLSIEQPDDTMSLSGIERQTQLSTLSLACEQITRFQELHKLSNLNELYLDVPGLHESDYAAIGRLPLKYLSVDHPRTLAFINSLQNLESLRIKNLNANNKEMSFEKNKSLKYLDLAQIDSSYTLTFTDAYPRLAILTLESFEGSFNFHGSVLRLDTLMIGDWIELSNLRSLSPTCLVLGLPHLDSYMLGEDFLQMSTEIFPEISQLSIGFVSTYNVNEYLENLKKFKSLRTLRIFRADKEIGELIKKALPHCKIFITEDDDRPKRYGYGSSFSRPGYHQPLLSFHR